MLDALSVFQAQHSMRCAVDRAFYKVGRLQAERLDDGRPDPFGRRQIRQSIDLFQGGNVYLLLQGAWGCICWRPDGLLHRQKRVETGVVKLKEILQHLKFGDASPEALMDTCTGNKRYSHCSGNVI